MATNTRNNIVLPMSYFPSFINNIKVELEFEKSTTLVNNPPKLNHTNLEKITNVNQLVQDSLSQKNVSSSVNNENVLSYPLKEAREKFEKEYLSSQLKKHKGNISKTAEFVGMERSALHRKLKSLGIKGIN